MMATTVKQIVLQLLISLTTSPPVAKGTIILTHLANILSTGPGRHYDK